MIDVNPKILNLLIEESNTKNITEGNDKRQLLDSVYDKIIGFLMNQKIVSSIIGIGSYFTSKPNPSDVDLVAFLNIPFVVDGAANHILNDFQKQVEQIKDSISKVNPYLNLFLVDSLNNKLNSVDLYYVFEHGEDIVDNIKMRKNQIKWIGGTKIK